MPRDLTEAVRALLLEEMRMGLAWMLLEFVAQLEKDWKRLVRERVTEVRVIFLRRNAKKSIPCASQANDTLKPLSTNALGNQYVHILHLLPKTAKPAARTAIVKGKIQCVPFWNTLALTIHFRDEYTAQQTCFQKSGGQNRLGKIKSHP